MKFTLDCKRLRQTDVDAVEKFRVPGIILMENAGRGIADTLCQLGIPAAVYIHCGHGNNAGDGLVLARHLELRGVRTHIIFWNDPTSLKGDALINFRIAEQFGLNILTFHTQPETAVPWLDSHCTSEDWQVDALLGTGIHGAPRYPLDKAICWINTQPHILAVDIPSGLDADSGIPSGSYTVRASHTCTLAAFKTGFLNPEACSFLGTVHLLDIGVDVKKILLLN